MPTISFSGLSSGIDTSGWVDALVSVRQQTITSLQEQQEAQEALLNVVNEIKSYFSSFQSCLSKITDSQFGIPTMDLFMQNLAVSSNTNIATATATTEAARQSYDVVVDSLATATKATSGYNQYEVKYATLDTQIGLLGAKNGTITVNQQSFSVTTEDTIRSLIQKFQNVGVSAEFNEQKGTFTVGVSLSEIDEGATNIKSALKLQDNTVSGAISGSLVYADRDTEFSKLGLTDGKVMIEGVEHTIAQNGNSYTITKAGGTAADLNTVGDFLDYLMSSAVGAESADVDDMGNISIKGATLDAVAGGSNIIDILNLSETFNRTAMESNRLTYIDVHVADLNTKLSDMGINATTTLTVGGNTHNITQDMTLGDIQNLLAAGNVDFEIDDKGVITIDTKGNEISGTLLDVLGLDPSKNGSTITSTAHQSKYEADGNTLLSDLGVNNSHNYVAYDSEGKALTGNINNVSGKTINELITDLKNAGLDASFDSTSHQIVINDGYIEGTLADALGMSQKTTSYTESATVNTTLEKLGATGNETLTIDGGTAKTYGKDTTLETVFNDIKAAGGDVTFKDGNVTIQGVTLGGTLPALLGLDATTQGTSVTSGALTVVTDSSSSGSDMDATIEHDITLSSKIGDILGTTSNYTLSVDGGAATTYTKDTTLQTLKTQIEAAGGTFTINDDNTISIENVTMSGTLVGALGFDSVENGTRFSTVNPVYIPGATTVANGSTSLDELFGGASGISTFSTTGVARAMAAPAAAPRAGGYTLSINGGAEISYASGVTLDDIFADIIAAGGSASIDSDGYIVIDGVHLEGTLVDALGLVETSYGTTITSGNLEVTESMTSTSSSTLMGEKEGNLSWDSTVGSITGDDKSYLMGINGTTHTYATDVKLSDIRDDIVAAGGSMTLNSDNTISITGVSIDGTLATALGFDITDYKTTISSNTPIYAKTEDVEATASTTFNDLGINTNLRDYAIYLPDGTIVKASSEAGSSGTATIGDWLNEINNALNTANGTSGQTYAKIENGVISITGGGYVTGSLPTALGMLTEEVITGTTMVGSPISYIEYEPLKYITSIQNGTGESGKDITYTGSIGNATNQSGTAADGVTSDGLIGPEDEFVDLFGNITDATLNATLSELLTPGASDPLNNDARLPADSYTLKIGSYATKTFDSDTTTLQDVIDYVDTLKTYDPTYDMAFDAYLSGNKLVIKTDMDISGTLADVIGLTKVKTEDEYYTYVAKNVEYTALVEGASNGFNFSIVGDKVYYDKTETGTKDGYEYTGVSLTTSTTIGQLFGDTNSHTLTVQVEGGSSKNITFSSTDTVQSVIDKLAAEGIDASVTADHRFKVFDESRWTLSGDVATKLFGGSGNDVYTYTGNKVTYTETVVIPGAGGNYNYTGEKIQYSTTHTGFPSSYTKLVDIFGSEVIGKQIIYKDYSSSNCMNHHGSDHPTMVTIDANTTIDSLNLHSNAFIYFNYDPTNGEFIFTKTKFSDGCEGQVSGSFLSYLKSKYSSDVTSTTLGTIGGITQSQEKEVISLPDSMNTTTTTNHDMTTSTTMKDLFGNTSSHTLTVKVEGGTAKNLTFSSTDTVQTVINKLAAEGITASVTADHRFRVEADNRWTLSGEMAPKLFGGSGNQVYTCTGNKITYDETTTTPGTADPDGFIDAPDIHNPPSGGSGGSSGGGTTTITEYYYQGSKVTYGGTSGTGYAASTKISDIRSSAVGTRWYVIADNYTGSTTGFVGQSAMFRYIDINANTTIQDVVDFFNSSAGVQSASYSTLTGEMSVTTQNGYQFHVSNVPYSTDVHLPAEGSGQTTPGGTYKVAFGKSAGTPASTATLTTKLSDLGSFLPAGIGFSVTNNGATTDLTFSSTDTISTVVNKLNSLGLEASFLNGALRVSSSYSDFEITTNGLPQRTFVNKLFGGSLPSIQTNTTTIDPNAITESTTLGELGITSGTLSNNGISLVGGSVPTRTFTSDNTLGDVFSYLEAGGATVTLNTDGTVSITGNAELSGDLLGQLGITLTSSKKTAVISSLTLTYGEKNLALSDRLSTLGLSGSYTIGTNGWTVLANSTVSNLVAALKGLNTSSHPDFGTVGGIGGGNIEGFHGGEYKNVSYDPTTGILEFTITGRGSAAYMPAGTLFSALDMVSRVQQATDGNYDTTYQYRLTKPGKNVTTATTLKQIFGDTSTTTHTIKVNGQTGTFSSTDNMGKVIDWLNANVGTASLSAGQFSLEYTPTGGTGLFPGNMQGDLGLWISQKSAKGYETETVYNGTLTKVSGSTSGAQYVSDVDSFVSGETYLIKSAADLNKLASLVNNGADTTNVSFILENDIDMSSVANFAGIGIIGRVFKGNFYGNGHVIKNLTMTSSNNMGFFNNTDGATIQDVGLENVNITSTSTSDASVASGSLIGSANNTIIKNTYVDGGNITSSSFQLGGLIGRSSDSTIEGSWSDVEINVSSASISDSYFVGGLVGSFYGGTIENSFSSSNITGSALNVGGLIGAINDNVTITNAYADGNVSSTRTDSNVGGLIGQVHSASVGTITNAFYSGSTLSGTNVGGFIGGATSGGGLNILNSAYNSAANANAISGGSLSGVNSMTMEQLTNQAIMQNMGFTAANGWVYTSGLTPHFGNVTISSGNGVKYTGSTVKEAQTVTSVSRDTLVSAFNPDAVGFKFRLSNDSAIAAVYGTFEIQADTTVGDIMEYFENATNAVSSVELSGSGINIKLKNNYEIYAANNNADYNILIGDLMGDKWNLGLNARFSINPPTATTSTTLQEITGRYDGQTSVALHELRFSVNGTAHHLSFSGSSTVQDVLDELNAIDGITATFTDGKLTVESTYSDLTFTQLTNFDIAPKLFGGSVPTPEIINSGSTTVTKDATLSTTVGQLIEGYSSGTIIVNGGSNISVNSSTTIQDIIDAFNNQGIIATWNNGKISLEASSAVSITENNGLINKLFGSTSVSLTGSGGGSDSYTMEGSIGSGGSTTTEITHDANLNTTVGQLVDGYSSGTITVSGGTNISVNSSTTIKDIIEAFNNQGITASWNNGQISVESGKTVTISDSNGLISKLFGSSSITLNPVSSVSGSYTMDKVSSGSGSTTNTYIMDETTTIGDLFGDSNNHTFTVNGNDITLGPNDTVQDLIDKLADYDVTATINDGKMTIGSNSDSLLTVSGDLANKVLGKTGSGSVDVDYKTEQKTLSLSTTMTELFWDTNSHDFVITKENGSKTTISLSGNQTVQDLITKLQANGIVATLDSSGKLTFKSNYKWSVSGDLGNKVTEGVMNLTVTPLYTFESEELETYTGHQTVSEILNAGGTLITGNRYHIASVDDLKALATFVNERGLDTTDIDFVLDGDLNLAGVSGLVPIGTAANAFKGNFYGNGHVISNLKITSTGGFVGLFGAIENATIRDLGLENVDISGGSRVGALVGYATNSTIENVYSTGKVTGTSSEVGGLIGDSNSSTGNNLYSTVEVSGTGNVGGLVGYLGNYSTLENVYATGDVRSSATQAGGLVGGVRYGGTIKNAYATGDVYGVKSLGGLVGLFEGVDGDYIYTLDTVYSTGRVLNINSPGASLTNSGALLGNFVNGAKVTVTNAVYNTDLEMAGVGSGSASGLTGLTYVEMQDASRMQGLGFTTAKGWKYISDKMTPVLNSVVVDNTGRTYSGEKLYVRGLTEFEAGDTYYIGTKEDLIRLAELVNAGEDTTGSVFILDGDIDMSGVDFAPIGDGSQAGAVFRGDFYGNGHTISNLTINNTTTDRTGLFGVLDGAHIQDLAIVNANVKGNGSNTSYVGILASKVYDDAVIENVYTTGSVSNGFDVGGLVGSNSGTITKSYSTATVSGNGSVGGLVGNNAAGAVIKLSYATGNVLSGVNVGGFAGFNSGTIESSYATGRVNGSSQTGGFVGYNGATITNSYATGFVDEGTKKGGFAGNNAGTITGAVYNQSTKLNAAGSGSSSGITGLELSQMWEQDRMEGLGFTADKGWNYTDNTTPFLNTNNTMINGDKTYVRDAQSFDSGEVFYIGTAQDLVHLAELVNNGAVTTGVTFVLDTDIDMTGVDFEHIGTSSDAFKGVFMGNGHTISGLKTSLFGDVENAIIRDVGLENVNINATANSTGALAGSAEGTTEIVNSYAKGTITSSKSNIGGLVGSLNSTSSIKSSYAEVNVTGSASVGGLVGLSAGTIENSSATGTVKASSSTAGGFVGRTTGGSITNSFAAGNVTASSAAGGFVGSASGTTITGSYAAGIVSGGSGFIGSVSGSNSFSGNVYNNANSAGAGGGTGVSLDDIKSQSVMESLGFTSDKGWVYYEGQAPQLRGKDTSKQYTVDASLDSILANLGSTTISKDITVEVNGTTQTKHFNDTDTVQDVMDWLNGISGVTAVFDEATSKLTISTDDGEMNVTGGLANTLFGGYANKVLDKITQNTDSSHLMAAGGDVIITEDTTVKQLLNSNNSASIGFKDEDGTVVMESFDPDQTLGEVLDWLNAHGFNASITNGIFTAVKEDGSQTDILGAIGSALKGENGTTTSTPSGYVSDVLTSVTGEKATGTTQLSALGIDSGNIHIQDASGKIVQTIQINNNMTVNDVATLLSAYGITMSINDGKVTVATDGPVKLVDGSSNMVSQMQLDNWIETKSKLTNTSTVAEMGFSQGASLSVIIDGRPTTISFKADDTLDDIIARLNTLGIEASVDADGKFTATSDNGFILSDELGVYLTQNSVDGYVNFANGYKSDKPLESPGNSTILTEDSLVGDILGTGEGGILRLTLDENNVVDLRYNADDTMQDIMVDLAAYGIETQIKNGVLTAVNLNRTFTFSGDIGKAISGDTPLYENIETGYISKDLSYETVETANMNSTMKELGILGGQIHILNSEGGIVTTLEVDESFTVSQIRSMLSPYGFNLTMDSNGKVSMTSSEGYSVSDGTSNLAAVMGLDNWNQTTEKLALDTTISEMGFKDGADLNLFLDGAVMNVLSFDADQTLQDVIFALSAYGIDASVDANGKFSAVSKDHTFIMSSTLGSFLTKGTSGYVNDDTGYQTVEALEEEKPYTVNSSEKLGYEKLMSADSTLASLGYENGGSVIVNLDGGTYYTLSFLGTDTVQDVIYALSPYGITAEVGADGKFNAVSTDHSFTLTGNVGNFLTSGGAYQNEVTGYESDPITFETTEKVTLDTKLSDLGVSHGDLNIMKDGKVTGSTINITDDTTVGQLFNAIKVYGMEGKIMTDTNGDTYIRISADSNTYLADGTANIVSGLGLVEIRQGDFEGNVIYWEDDTDSGLITEDMLLSTLDKNGYIAQGSLIFETGTGDEAVQHIINITADETVGSLIKKFQDAGINASLSNGVIKISSGLDGITFTGGTSGLVNTIGLDIEDVDVYASSSSALTYEGNVHYSAANFATGDTLLSIVNATEGDMSVFVDGVKCTIHVDPNQTFADLFAQISSTVAARTGLNIKAGFLDKEGNIVVNPTDDKNTGIVAFEIEEGHELVIGASNDTTNFATIANLNKTDFNQITGSRSLYRVNVNSLLTESGLYRDGDITEGTFKIGDAEFTIDSTTTLASLIDQINRSQTAYATAYWDTLSGTMVIQSTLTGASLINIEAGTSNFTDIMGFTTVTDTGASALVTSSQTLGKNAVVRINGTTVTATSNVITSDVSRIKGLTINLKDVSEGETVTITVEQDDEAIFNAVSDTIDAYNAMMEALNKELSDKSTLGNEALLKLMRNNLKRLMTSSLSGAYVFKNLAAIGISTGEAQDSITLDVTSLMIDKDTFMNALDTDSDAVKALLVGTQTNPGIFLQANNIVESSIKSSGYFSNMIDSLTRNIDRIEEKINKTNDEINKYRDRLERQFHNMELTISGLQNAYSAFLN